MNGRYRMDGLTAALFLAAAILLSFKYVWILGAGFTAYALFRVLSKNIASRKKEQEWFHKHAGRLGNYLKPFALTLARGLVSLGRTYSSSKLRLQQRKQYVFIKCSKCKNLLRLPRNKGKLSVTCPVCKSEFITRT